MKFKIQNRLIGDNHPVFIIAELSANHLQDFDLAKTIKAMKNSGADAVKLQTYTPDTITINCDNQYFQINQVLTWQILEGKNEIPITLSEPEESVDGGKIYIQDIMHFNGDRADRRIETKAS